jgi:anti-sigma regulatory factor (Ser/Thr protein kinase)
VVDLPPEPVWIDADAVRVAQMLGNLLTNACKYTPQRGRIEISARPIGAMVQIRVADTGIGIDPDKLPQLFEFFSQIDVSMDRSQGGLGIGLALVRRLATLHGGTVHAHSEGRGKGTAFTLTLPLHQDRPERAREAERFVQRLRDPRLVALYDGWAAACSAAGDGRLPPHEAVRLGGALAEHAFVAEVASADPLAFRYLRVGRALGDRLGQSLEGGVVEAPRPLGTLAGSVAASVEVAVGHEALGGLAAAYARCVRTTRPAYDYARWRGGQGVQADAARVDRLLVPCSADGRSVTHLLGMILIESETDAARTTPADPSLERG